MTPGRASYHGDRIFVQADFFFFKEVDDTEQMYFWETLSLKLSSKKNALLFPNLAELLYEFRDNLILKFRAS